MAGISPSAPDGMLYISMGDGGGADDRDGQLFIVPYTCGMRAPIVGHGEGNAQNLTNSLGKILRINPTSTGNSAAHTIAANAEYAIPLGNAFAATPGALTEIFAFGFRNPYQR